MVNYAFNGVFYYVVLRNDQTDPLIGLLYQKTSAQNFPDPHGQISQLY